MPDPVRWFLQYSMAALMSDDDLRRWCDADRAMLDALMADDRAMLDALMAADRAYLDGALMV